MSTIELRKYGCTKLGYKRGYTMTELLIVIAIIAIMAAMLLPVIHRVRASARRASCMSNLRQLGLAVLEYAEDSDGRLPSYMVSTAAPPPSGRPASGQWYWNEIVYAYHKNAALFYCPSGAPSGSPWAGQYGANMQVLRGQPILLSGVQAPSAVYLCMDAGSFGMDPTFYTVPGQLVSTRYLPGTGKATGRDASEITGLSRIYWNDYTWGRHFGGIDMCYADGHVHWLPTIEVIAEAKRRTPNLYGAWNYAYSPS
jgi:prepilin-type N-terminal cleavage/methylation domain-containing protein